MAARLPYNHIAAWTGELAGGTIAAWVAQGSDNGEATRSGVFVDRPPLIGPLPSAAAPTETTPGQAFQVVLALLRLECQGRHHEIVAYRGRLTALSAPLSEACKSTR